MDAVKVNVVVKNTQIEWAENTINFHVGCTKVSPGCANCYAERIETRFGRDFNTVRHTNWDSIKKNLKKRRKVND